MYNLSLTFFAFFCKIFVVICCKKYNQNLAKNFFPKFRKKAVHHKQKFPFFKMRALCSKVIFNEFFVDSQIDFSKLDIKSMSIF